MEQIVPRRSDRRPVFGLSRIWALLPMALAVPAGATQSELFAGPIESDTAPEHVVRGPDAVGGLGDWVLSNGRVCATVSSPEHEALLSPDGGILVDLGHCNRHDDQWTVLETMLNLSRERVVSIDTIRAELIGDEARIVTLARDDGLRIETTFSLAPKPSNRLRIETRVERESPGEAIFLLGDVQLHGSRQLTPFTLASGLPGTSVGFAHPEVDIENTFAMGDAMVRADLQVLVGDATMGPGIAYGWRLVEAYVQRADGTRESLAHLVINGEQFSILGSYTDTLWFGGGAEPSLLELGQTLFMDLEPGESLVQVREILLAQSADVAGVTDQIWSDGPLVQGSVDAEGTAIHVRGADGRPFTFLRSGAEGRFEFRLPAGTQGDFEIETVRPSGARGAAAFRVSGGDRRISLPPITSPAPAWLRLPQGEPVRLVFRGIPPTRDPVFGSDGTQFSVGGVAIPHSSEASTVSLAGTDGDPIQLELMPGRYRVLATRGLEWGHGEREVKLAPGEVVELEPFALEHQVHAPGWISADLHVHSGLSDDSALASEDRVRSFAAEGADVMVVTEHDQLADYQPIIRKLGLNARMVAIPGVEMTSTAQTAVVPSTAGHANAFPLESNPRAYRAGAPAVEDRRLRDILADLAKLPAPPLVQLNHPREGGFDSGLGAYFSHLSQGTSGLDPTRPLSDPQHRSLIEAAEPSGLRDIDFHAIELLNGPSMRRYRLTRADWFSLWLQGERRAGTANSDSHSLREIVALPRNYVAYSGPEFPRFDREAFVAAVRAGRIYGTTGPVLEVRLGDRGPGETFRGSSGELQVRVRAADWVPVDELRIFINGALHSRQPIGRNESVRIPLEFPRDSFVLVEVEGAAAADSVYAQLAPGFTPFAFTNPVLVDADEDGHWQPPGLVSPLPPTLADPLHSP